MKSGLFAEITKFVRFGESDRQALVAFRPLVQPHLSNTIDRFYENIETNAAARSVLRNDAQTERLKGTLRHWLHELLSGPWDQAYCEKRQRIGRMHVKVGLPQRFMSAGMSLIRDELIGIANQAYADDPATRSATVGAITRVLDLDLTIMLESYSEDTLAVVRRIQEHEHEVVEQQLRLSEARYQAVIEEAEIIVITVANDGRLVMFNRTAERITEYSRTELAGTPVFETICNQQCADQLSTAVAGAFRNEPPPPFEGRIISRRGVERWIRWHVRKVGSNSEAAVCALGVDVTDERKLQLRTQQSEKMATLGHLAAGLAHEIRNPLNSAQLQLMLVNRRIRKLGTPDQTAEAHKAAMIVRDELQRLAGLVEDFLEFARPSKLRITRGDLCELVDNVVKLITPEAAQQDVELNCSCKHTTVALFDDERIKQVVHNLIRNGIEAASTGGRVHVGVHRDATRAVIEVIDSGAGVPPELNIFEPFATSKTSGTGLGLPIVRRIVDNHEGDIVVERRDNHTVFHVELPLEGPSRVLPELKS